MAALSPTTIAPNEEGDQVAVALDLPQLQVIPLFAGGDDKVPVYWYIVGQFGVLSFLK